MQQSYAVPLWIFGYGSLLFRPAFPFEERRTAYITGFLRRLDQGSPDHRGTEERLGRVATLIREQGARAAGAVFRVAGHNVDDVLRDLDHREKGGYDRISVEARFLDGTRAVPAITWIARPDNPYALGAADLPTMLAQIRAAVGPSGPNIEYVLRLADTLRSLGIDDPYIEEIARALRVEASPDSA